jgi:hypothetical protein
MKNTIKLFGIIAFVAIIGFSMAACGDPSGGGDPDPDALNGSYLKQTNVQVHDADSSFAVINNAAANGNYNQIFNGDVAYFRGSLSDFFDGSPACTITNGKLTLNTGAMKDSKLVALTAGEVQAGSWDFMTEVNLHGSTGVKVGVFEMFCIEEDHSLRLWNNEGEKVFFVYLNKAATLSFEYNGMPATSINFNAGWNTIIFDSYVLKKVTPNSSYKWGFSDSVW